MKNIRSLTKMIASCDDFELNIKRKHPLTYFLTYPDGEMIDSVIFLIAGFGGDNNADYMRNLREFTASEYNAAVVSVNYHCLNSRLEHGVDFQFDDFDIMALEDIIKTFQFDLSQLTKIDRDRVLLEISRQIEIKKEQNQLPQNFKLTLPMTLVPSDNSYQNFGVMQALDHLYVLEDLKKNFPFLNKTFKTICVGSSHGGYLAHLMAKFSPDNIDYVIENSAYVKPPLAYIVGKENDIKNPEFLMIYRKNLNLHCYTQTFWTLNKNSPYYFSNDRYRIRDLTDKEHLQSSFDTKFEKTQFISYHSKVDDLAFIEEKVEYCKLLEDLGCKVDLKIIENEDEVDGKFIKNLTHGMGMSIKELIKIEVPKVLNKPMAQKKSHREKITFQCDTMEYIIENKENKIEVYCK